MQSDQIQSIYSEILHKKIISADLIPPIHPRLVSPRPNSFSVTDVFFGDSGKGSIIAKLNKLLLKKRKKLYSLRFNGGANAGHETFFYGKRIVFHQLPVASLEQDATALMLRGMLLHPADFVNELTDLSSQLGDIPAKLHIDDRILLGLDTHRAYEFALNSLHSGGRGATGRGIAPGYGSVYLRIAVTLKDLLDKEWKSKLSAHYQLYEKMIYGIYSHPLAAIEVPVLAGQTTIKQPVGTLQQFLKRLQETREVLSSYAISDMYEKLFDLWNKNTDIPVTIEGAQAAGLDPYHGIYPDVTASRPLTRSINDSTYNIICLEDIGYKTAAMKTTYVSSVGTRKLPFIPDPSYASWIQKEFDERGRSTGRLRDIYPISLPLASYFRRADGYEYLMATHLDAAKADQRIPVITHYTYKKSGKEAHILPYQDYLDTLVPHTIYFDGWDGEEIKKVTSVTNLPTSAKRYLAFLVKTIGPIFLGTTGADIDQYISWIDI